MKNVSLTKLNSAIFADGERCKPGGTRANEKSRTPTSVTQGKQRQGPLPSGGYGGIDKGDGTGAGATYKRS
jgi:hypothetical protein